jgi:hypothetical protein
MQRRFATLAAAATFALAFSVTPALASSPSVPAHGGGANLTCAGGSIAGGTYNSVTVTGLCTVDTGSIMVRRDLVIQQGGVLLAWYGGSNVTVDGDLRVGKNGVLVLGCGLPSSVCFDDPGDYSYRVAGNVGHDLKADGALAVVVHNTAVGHDVDQHGGGGGLNCDLVMLGSPAFSTYEDTTIGGSVTITGLRTCWLGFLGNTVGHNVDFNNNRTFVVEPTGPDGNEIAANTIGGNLNCARNNPAPQVGDSGLPLNIVGRHATGQCAGLKA